MDLLNATKMVAGYTLGVEPSGREHLVVVVKGTFALPGNGEEPKLARSRRYRFVVCRYLHRRARLLVAAVEATSHSAKPLRRAAHRQRPCAAKGRSG